jgi:hypothetical protein
MGTTCYLTSPSPMTGQFLRPLFKMEVFLYQQGFPFSDSVWGYRPHNPLPGKSQVVLGRPTSSTSYPPPPKKKNPPSKYLRFLECLSILLSHSQSFKHSSFSLSKIHIYPYSTSNKIYAYRHPE